MTRRAAKRRAGHPAVSFPLTTEPSRSPQPGLIQLGAGAAVWLVLFACTLPPPVPDPDPEQTVGTRWMLAYPGGPRRPAYSVSDFVHLLAYVDPAGRPADWLSTGVIFLELRAPSGRLFTTWVPDGEPSTGADWEQYLDTLFVPGGILSRLDSAVGVVGAEVGPPPDLPFPVVVMIPFPEPAVDTLRYAGGVYRLREESARAEVAVAFVTDVIRRFQRADHAALGLHGFYWLKESIRDADGVLVRRIAEHVHSEGYQFFWIPFFTAWGVDRWREWGFDAAWLQPNYFFNVALDRSRLDSAVVRARRLEMGLEIEFNGRLLNDSAYADRLDPYLDALRAAPDLRRASVATYEGGGALLRLSRSRNPQHRAIYCRFVSLLTHSDGRATHC